MCQLNVTGLISRIKNQMRALPTAVPEEWRNANVTKLINCNLGCFRVFVQIEEPQKLVQLPGV